VNKGLSERLTFMVTPEEHQWMLEQSRITGVPFSEIIRRAIKAYRESLEKKKD